MGVGLPGYEAAQSGRGTEKLAVACAIRRVTVFEGASQQLTVGSPGCGVQPEMNIQELLKMAHAV